MVDGLNAQLLKTFQIQNRQSGALLAYDHPRDRLITANSDTDPAGLFRYRFDPNQLTLTLEQALQPAGYNALALAISPDSRRLAFVCGGGNVALPPYSIADYSPADFTVTDHSWFIGPYPSGGAFSPDSTVFASTDGTQILIFDAATHVLLASYTPPSCPYGRIEGVAVSRGGRIVYAHTTCGFGHTSSLLSWMTR